MGLLAGLFLIAISMGYVNAPQQAMETAYFLGVAGLAISFVISITRKIKRGSVSNPKMDGFFIGFGMASTIVAVLLYGFSFP